MRLKPLAMCLSLGSAIWASCMAKSEDSNFTSGHVHNVAQGKTTPLTAEGLTAISAWLQEHRSGWRTNLASPPVPLVFVTLDTPSRKSVVRLDLWPGPSLPGWNHAVIMWGADGYPVGTQTLPAEDLNALLQMLN
jgi:hypothetical protein